MIRTLGNTITAAVAVATLVRRTVRWWRSSPPSSRPAPVKVENLAKPPLVPGPILTDLRDWWDCDAWGCIFLVGQEHCIGCGTSYDLIETEFEAEDQTS